MEKGEDYYIDQWNRINSPERKLYVYGDLIFNNSANLIQWGKNYLFNNDDVITEYPHANEWKLDAYMQTLDYIQKSYYIQKLTQNRSRIQIQELKLCQAWWYTAVMPLLRWLRQGHNSRPTWDTYQHLFQNKTENSEKKA